MTLQAIGFDLGETLIHFPGLPLSWQSVYRDALLNVARHCNYSCADAALQQAEVILLQYNTRVKPRLEEVSSTEIFTQILNTWKLPLDPHLPLAIETFFSFFQRQAIAYPDAVQTLQELKAMGLKIGVLTDVPYGMSSILVQRDLEQTGLAALVDILLTSLDVGLRKPAPQGHVELARQFGCAVNAMLYVGNEPKDIQGAHAAGMKAVFIKRAGLNGEPDNDFYNKQCYFINNLQELVSLVHEHNELVNREPAVSRKLEWP